MDLLVDLLLLLAAWILLVRSNTELDEVWALCLRLLSVASLLAVISNERGQPLAIALLELVFVAFVLAGIAYSFTH